MPKNRITTHLRTIWQACGLATTFKQRRLSKIDSLVGGRLFEPGRKVVEIGCKTGQDYIRFAADKGVEIIGVDRIPMELDFPNTRFVQADAVELPFYDKEFDVALSIGVLEHIQPIENLCRTISEMRRVAKSFCVVIPALTTVIEPHEGRLFWALRKHGHKFQPRYGLNYFSDEAWLQFNGFSGAKINRFFYAPPLIANTIISHVD